MKRICLFAGYNYSNIISKYVPDYLEELSKYADIYYLADGQLPQEQLYRIEKYTKGAWVENHHGYDFYSYKLLVEKYVGWNTINQYDELIFANDSCFCVNSFAKVFQKTDHHTDWGFWGLLCSDALNTTEFSDFQSYLKLNTKETHIGSYFMTARKSFFKQNYFHKFIADIKPEKVRNNVYYNYELGIFKLAKKHRVKMGVFDENIWRYSSIYMREAFNLIKSGFPLLKVRIFVDNIGGASLINELAEVSAPFCDFDYRPYIKDIQNERTISLKKEQERKKHISTFRKIKRYLIPPLILDMFRIRKIKKFIKFVTGKEQINKFVNYIFPPILIDLFMAVNNFLHKGGKNKLRLSIIPRPKYGGFYPNHIKDYDKMQMMRVNHIKNSETMVVFFNVMREYISGGMLSIERFLRHSQAYAQKYDIDVVLSGIPLVNACIENPYFDYKYEPVDFKYISKYTKPEKLQLNIPECFVPDFLNDLSKDEFLWLWSIPDLRINILNQNDELMPDQQCIEELRCLCNNKLSITVAHQRYFTKKKEEQYKCPLYLLTPFLPEFYKTPVEKKEKIIVLSPDEIPEKEEIKKKLKKNLPDYQFITIKEMTLEEYKKTISKALFCITFGEGYDGYFIEPYLSDSISFSVRNPLFFPENFKDVPTVYSTWNELLNNIIQDIRKYEKNHKLYRQISAEVVREIRKFTNNKQSEKDLEAYYKRFNSNFAE